MPQIRFYAPHGVRHHQLTTGKVIDIGSDGYVVEDSNFASELLRAGFTPAPEGAVTLDEHGRPIGRAGVPILASPRIVAMLGDSFVWGGHPCKSHIKDVTIATGVATFTLAETNSITNTFRSAGDSVDVGGLPRAFKAMNGADIPVTAINTGNNTFSIATSLGDVAKTNIKTGAVASPRAWRISTMESVFTGLEWLLGNAIKVPRSYRRGWGGGGFVITGAGFLPFSAQCRQLILDAGALVPHEVWLHYGTNDAASSKTLAQIQEEVRAGLEILRRGGVQKVRLSKIWPRVVSTWDTTKEAVAVSVNTWYDTLASEFVSILDATSVLQDTGLAGFQPIYTAASNEGTVKSDGLHPSFRGGMRFALAVLPSVAPDFPVPTRIAAPFAGTSAIAVTDISGTVPTGWSAAWNGHTNGSGTAVVSTDAATGEITVTLDAPATDKLRLTLPTKVAGTIYEPETVVKQQVTLDVVSAAGRFRTPWMQFTDTDGTNNGYIYTNTTSAVTDYLDAVPVEGLAMSSDEYTAKPGSLQLAGNFVEMHAAGVGVPIVLRLKDFTM